MGDFAPSFPPPGRSSFSRPFREGSKNYHRERNLLPTTLLHICYSNQAPHKAQRPHSSRVLFCFADISPRSTNPHTFKSTKRRRTIHLPPLTHKQPGHYGLAFLLPNTLPTAPRQRRPRFAVLITLHITHCTKNRTLPSINSVYSFSPAIVLGGLTCLARKSVPLRATRPASPNPNLPFAYKTTSIAIVGSDHQPPLRN